jgi:hypothetical protein
VTIVARQKFALPLFWQMINLDFFPQIKDKLVSDAYVTFFSRTMANYEAVCEGREPFIGQHCDAAYGEPGLEAPHFVAQQLQDLLAVFSGVLEKFLLPSMSNGRAPEGSLDELGYHHFSHPPVPQNSAAKVIKDFAVDLARALEKDLKLMAQAQTRDKP